MRVRHYAVAWLWSSLCTFALVASASAHVRLSEPMPRYPAPVGPDEGEMLKDGPCGVTGDARTTDTTRITTYQPGETITVRFRETINHPGHFRIAFDAEGQDAFVDPASVDEIQEPPVLPILKDGILDASGNYETMVTLPSTPCSSCTLQLIQVMSDKGPEWGDDDIYYQCADIVIAGDPAGGSGGSGGSSGSSSSGGSGNGGAPASGGVGTSGAASVAGTGSASGGASAGGSFAAGGASGANVAGSSGLGASSATDTGGCSVGGAGRPALERALLSPGLLLFGLWFARHRRDRRAGARG